MYADYVTTVLAFVFLRFSFKEGIHTIVTNEFQIGNEAVIVIRLVSYIKLLQVLAGKVIALMAEF